MRRVGAFAVLAVAITAAIVLSAGKGPGAPIATYKIQFDNIFGLTEGGDMTVAGVKAGKTSKFEVTNDAHPKALVTAEISKPGFTPFRADAHCDIRQESLIGTYYVSCQPGHSPRILRDGATIPVEQTSSTIPFDLVNDIMRAPYKDRLRILLTELGTGLAGRPQDIAATLKRAHPGLQETSKTLQILGQQNEILKNFITNSDTVLRELDANKEDVARFVRTAGRTAAISATRQNDIRRGFQRLPSFLNQLQPTMARLGELSDAQVPTLIDLQRAAPDLNRFLVESEPFARTTRPVLRSLGRTSLTGIRAIDATDRDINQLRQAADPLPQRGSAPSQQGLARPLRQLLVSLDDRHRSVEEDKRAQQTGPPPPDPTAYFPGQGFTGMEALLNVNYNLALAINIFDDTSHFLRVLLLAPPQCGSSKDGPGPGYTALPTPEQQRACSSYLGNYQPCIPGKAQPTPAIRDRPEICGSGSASGTSSSGNDSKRGQPEAKAAAAPKPQPKPGARAATSKPRPPAAPPGKSAPKKPPAPSPGAAPQPGASAKSAPPAPAAGPDKDLQLMDYFLGQ